MNYPDFGRGKLVCGIEDSFRHSPTFGVGKGNDYEWNVYYKDYEKGKGNGPDGCVAEGAGLKRPLLK